MYLISGILAVAGCISMVLLPTVALESARKGFTLWVEAVLPSLLPFFICANFMISIGIPNMIGRFFERFFQRIFGVPGSSAFVFIISISSGYPMGPKLIGDMGRRGEITIDDARKMLSFCSTSGPLFMLGTVGVGMLHSPLAGVVIAVSHYLGAFVNGILFNLISRKKDRRNVTFKKSRRFIRSEKRNLLELFTDSILSSLKTLGIICCYLVIFTIIADYLELSGILDFLSHDYQKGLLKGLLEMTVGSYELSLSSEIAMKMKCVLATFMISFGGFSTLAQSMSVLYGLNISVWSYMKVKLTHGLISCTIAFFIAPYILNKAISTVGAFNLTKNDFDLGMLSQLLFSTQMIIIILIVFAISVALDNCFGRKEHQSE